MLRPFSLVSDDLVYVGGAGGVAEIRFPAVPKGSARCAIVGIRAQVAGTAGIVEAVGLWGSLVERLSVAGRNYFQGQAPLPLLGSDNFVVGLPYGFPAVNRFLGSHIPLPGGSMLGDGTLGAGIGFGPNDEVRMRVSRLSEDSFANRIVLDCVQFPDNPRNPENAIWDALRNRGLGEVLFVGSRLEGWPAPGTVTLFEELPQPPNARALRRTGFRAVVTDDIGAAFGFEVGDVASTTMNNILAQVWTSFQRAPQNQLAPARTILGLTGLETPTGLVDMQENERSMVQLVFAGTAAADPARNIYVLHMFEGRDESSETLEAANAIS